MKKLLLLSIVALTAVPLLGLVWAEDPTISEEKRQERREFNARIHARGLLGSSYQAPQEDSADDADDDLDFDDED